MRIMTAIAFAIILTAASACGETLKETIHSDVDDFERLSADVYGTAVEHSEAYSRSLDLSSCDLASLDRMGNGRAFVVLSLAGGCSVELIVHHVCGVPYGGAWADLVLAHGSSECKAVEEMGAGTSYITHLSKEDHLASLTQLMR